MIVIAGATGHIGKKTAEILLDRSQKVKALARSQEKLSGLKSKGADTAAVSLDDANALAAALKGADAAFLLIPPNYGAPDFRAYQNKLSEAIVKAVTQSGIKYVVNLSSLGAHRGEKGGPINGLYDHEQRMNKLTGVNILHLRPVYFMENLMMNLPLIKNNGIAGSPLKPDLKFPMIATQDIAAEVAERLVKRDFNGVVVKELLGEREVTMKEVAGVLGKAVGKPDLPYVQFPYADAEKAMTQMGLSADVARLMIEMNQSFNNGDAKPTQSRSAQNTTATSIEEFAKQFAQAYKGMN